MRTDLILILAESEREDNNFALFMSYCIPPDEDAIASMLLKYTFQKPM